MNNASPRRMYFSTDALPTRDRFPALCEEVMRNYAGLELKTENKSNFSATLELQSVGSINIGYNSNVALDCLRTPDLLGDGDDRLYLVLLESGSVHSTQRHIDRRIGPGEAVVCDSAYLGECNFTTDARHWHLRIPRDVLAPLLPRDVRFAGARLDVDTAARRLLFAYLAGTFRHALPGGGTALDRYEQHVIDLVALALGAKSEAGEQAEARGARAARRLAVLRVIKSRSGDPHLNANAVAAQFGITARYVHLLLEETGRSFTHHLLERRLERAAALLRDRRWRDRKISDIALEAGFTDLSYFSRAFRRQYRATPTEVRVTAWPET